MSNEGRQGSSPPGDEQRQVDDLMMLVQELAAGVAQSDSVASLFSRAFPALLPRVSFDVAVAVMLEQNLDLYVMTRAGAESLVDDRLVTRIRRRLEALIPVSFATTDVVVKFESHQLDATDAWGELEHETSALLGQGSRPAGMVMLCRSGPEFGEREHRLLTFFTTQLAMLLETVHARQEIARLADTDDLTGIWNRRYLRRQLPQEIERARTFGVPLSILMFDIDDFKSINDRFGHPMGDVVLSELCGAIREKLRPTDVLARVGGDEFTIVLPHTDHAGAAAVAERVLTRVRALGIPNDGDTIRCSVSIGIAEYQPEDGAAELVRRADERMYLAKRQGKNQYTSGGEPGSPAL